MDPIAAIFDFAVIYRYSLILALACGAGICFFMACCCHAKIPAFQAAATVLTAISLSLPLSRLVYWYGRPDQFDSFFQALTSFDAETFTLTGAIAGCALAVLIAGKPGERKKLLDCMSVSGCIAISLGQLGNFFTEACRGQIMVFYTSLPWAYPVIDVSGQPEYRFATFLFQSAAAAVIGIFLTKVFRRGRPCGDVTLLFLLLFGASQVILDSTRYDALHLRSNGFISIVQLLAALAMAVAIILFSIRAKKRLGFRPWMVPFWTAFPVLFGAVGYMEYYVQRHGQEAALSYTLMGLFLVLICALGLWLRWLTLD